MPTGPPGVHLRRWLLGTALLCALLGLFGLTVALCSFLEILSWGRGELWLLLPMTLLPLALGLAFIGRAAGRPPPPAEEEEDEG